MLKFIKIALGLFLLLITLSFTPKPAKKILVFSLTKGYRHQSINDGIMAIKKLGAKKGFEVDTSQRVASFTSENLSLYDAIIFLNPTGSNVFNAQQKQALKSYINGGGGFVGIHAATDFCYEWEWYGKMVGAFFASHPKVQPAKLMLSNRNDKLNRGLPKSWQHTDEWYNFKSLNTNVNVLMTVDESSYNGGKMKYDHPVVWYHHFDGGRAFYTALGHTKDAYQDKLFLKQLSAGMEWAMKK